MAINPYEPSDPQEYQKHVFCERCYGEAREARQSSPIILVLRGVIFFLSALLFAWATQPRFVELFDWLRT